MLDQFWERNLKETDVPREEVDEILTEEQIADFVRRERKAQAMKDKQRRAARQEIRKLYKQIKKEYLEQAALEEEDVEEPEEEETDEARKERIHKLKLQFKSMNSLLQLDAAGEIFSTREVFANRGQNFRIAGTSGSIADYVAGYDVFLRDGPDPAGKRTRYRKMVVHFHFSDKAMSRVERAHFKNSHAAADKSHVIIKSSQQGAALNICKKYLS